MSLPPFNPNYKGELTYHFTKGSFKWDTTIWIYSDKNKSTCEFQPIFDFLFPIYKTEQVKSQIHIWRQHFNFNMNGPFILNVTGVPHSHHCGGGCTICGSKGHDTLCSRLSHITRRLFLEYIVTLMGLKPAFRGRNRSMQRLLMLWLLASPGHRQQHNCFYNIGKTLTSLRNDWNYPPQCSLKMQTYFYISWKKSAWQFMALSAYQW